MRYCTKCGAPNDDYAQYCTSCQAVLGAMQQYQPPLQAVNPANMVNWEAMGADKKIPAGICAILVGGFGVHKFIMGYHTEGIIQLVLGMCGIGWIIGLIEGIIYLTKSDEDFVRTYFQGRKGWF
jgi:TM2 domain-containing membrane protein YozV